MTSKPSLPTRRVGKTDLEITTLGLGCAALAGNNAEVPEAQARATIGHALDIGINYFDTSAQYGWGRSEHLVGNALRERRKEAVLSTKVGRLLKPIHEERPGDRWIGGFPFTEVYDYSYDGVMRSFEDSLQRLGLNKVDMLYVHDIGTATHGVDGNARHWEHLTKGGYKALQELKASGAVSAIGMGVNEWEVLMDALALGDWDVFLLAGRYTLLEQGGLNPLLSTCLERNTSVVIGGPFNSGILVGGETWNYAKAPEDVIARVKRLQGVCAEFGVPLPAAAIQFPLNHPAVCSVLPGPKSPEELDEIVAWNSVAIPEGLWTALAENKLILPGTPLPNGKVA